MIYNFPSTLGGHSGQSGAHHIDNMRIMQENVSLIKEINELRREIKGTKGQGGALNAKEAKIMLTMPRPETRENGTAGDLNREVQMQRDLIGQLRNELINKEELIKQLMSGTQVQPRPVSREKLPPMDNMDDAQPVPEI